MSTVTMENHITAANTAAAERLRSWATALRVSFTWFGTRKSLSPEQKAQAAETFGAEGEFLSAGKKLLDTRDPAFRAVTGVRGQTLTYFKAVSLPYPDPGVRLIRREDIGVINDRLTGFRQELADAVSVLEETFDELKRTARWRLGDLYREEDYPATLAGLFDLTWSFPSVEPPEYLQRLNPELYRQECERARGRFDEAVRLAEQAFTEELANLVEHLSERLQGDSGGKPKVFRDSAVENLRQFFDRFQALNIGSNEQLEGLVSQARRLVGDVAPQQLRSSGELRRQVSAGLAGVQSRLDQLLVDRPRRNIQRAPR